MGKVVHRPFFADHPQIIDYATSADRCDFLDVWLMANCHFAISTGVGLDSVADIFRRPQVFVNYLPLMDMEAWGAYITTPKILSWSGSGQLLTLREHLRFTSANDHYYRDNGIAIRDLSPSEIREAVMEMEARLSGTWAPIKDEEDLHQEFWGIIKGAPEFASYHGWIHPKARLGTHYLVEAREWFFDK
jgi:putative glycosyltransferase (TIGR04372 family)